MGIETEVSNSITLFNAFGQQAGGEALTALAELSVSEAVLSADNASLVAV